MPMLKNAIVIAAVTFIYINRENLNLKDLSTLVLVLISIYIFSFIISFLNDFYPKNYRETLIDVKPRDIHNLVAKFNVSHQFHATKLMILIASIILLIASILSKYSIIIVILYLVIPYFLSAKIYTKFLLLINLNIVFLIFVHYSIFLILNDIEITMVPIIISIISSRIYINEFISFKHLEERMVQLGLKK